MLGGIFYFDYPGGIDLTSSSVFDRVTDTAVTAHAAHATVASSPSE
ncbi:MAG: hypothetical protein ACYCYK_08760 [Candidatus Dormibacteria bacterium]